MPPILLAISGLRCWNASWMTSGAFSHQIEGITDPVDLGHQPRQFLASIGPAMGDCGAGFAERLVEGRDEGLALERRAAMDAQLELALARPPAAALPP